MINCVLIRRMRVSYFIFLVVFAHLQLHAQKNERGYVKIFDGKSLSGWEGDSTYWRVENGCLVGEVTPATLLTRNSFIIWKGGTVQDFELKAVYRVSKEGNSGINYRSEEVEGLKYALRGYQADLEGGDRFSGSNYEERRRTTLAARGQKVVLNTVYTNGTPDSLRRHIRNNRWEGAVVVKTLGNPDVLQSFIKAEGWNEYHLIVKGNRMRHYINGVLMSDVTDNDTENRRSSGLLGVQVHVGPPMKIEYRDFRLKHLSR